MAKLGFIGLGVMGSHIVERLLAREHGVTGYNRTRSKAETLIKNGMLWADSPRAACAGAEAVFVMVTDSAALASLSEGADGILAGLEEGSVLIDMSTVSPTVSRTLAANVREKGAEMIDAPVSGSVATLLQNKLSVMVGGPRETFERVKPLLQQIGSTVIHVGGNGSAVSIKIAINLSLAVQMLAFSEGILLAEKSGISRQTAVEVFSHSAVASPMIQYRGPFVLEGPKEAWFTVNLMQKDMLLALELGHQLNVPLPTTAVTNEFLTAVRSLGYGGQDLAVIFDALANMSGVKR
jgi:3-hydroxyisobutyrate dehydrogenase-like beta-hydroxyacid dehydrogenase